MSEKELPDPEIFMGVFDSLSSSIAVLDDTGVIIAVNNSWKRFAEQNGSADLAFHLGANYLSECEKAAAKDQNGLACKAFEGIKRVMQNLSDEFCMEYPCHSPNEKRWFMLRASGFRKGSHYLTIVAHDNITDRKKAALQLRQSEEMQRRLIESMPVLMDAFNDKLEITWWNKECERITGYSADEVIGNPCALEMLYPDAEYRQNVIASFDLSQDFRDREFTLTCKDGAEKTISWSNISASHPISDWHTWAVGVDVTKRKLAEGKLKSSVREKEVLLKELYHRTKNNMQVIMSMIDLQILKVSDKAVLALFKEIKNRIQSMAMVHKKLYQTKTLSKIDLKAYFAELLELLMGDYQNDAGKITIVDKMTPVKATIEVAIPCGLIINELVSNVFKHAFPGRQQRGEVHIHLWKQVEDIHFIFKDTGVGLPRGFDYRKTDSMGIQTIVVLVENQLGGRIEILGDQGTEYRIVFNPQFVNKGKA